MIDAKLKRRFSILLSFVLPPNGILSWTTMEVSDLLFYGIRNDIVIDTDKLRTYNYYRELIRPIVANLFGKVVTNTNDLYEAYKKSPSVFMVLLHAILKTHRKKELMPNHKVSFQIPNDYEAMMVDEMTETIKPLCYDNVCIVQNNTAASLITAQFTLPYTVNINKDAINILRRKYHIDISAKEIINVQDIALKILPHSLYDAIFVVLHLIYALYEYAAFYNYSGKDLRHKIRRKISLYQ